MRKRSKAIVAAAGVAAVVTAGAGAAAASGGSDGAERQITGDALTRASEAALRHSGGGKVTGTEVNDEESYYEVEVTTPDGEQVDVQLDGSFRVVGATPDVESTDGDR